MDTNSKIKELIKTTRRAKNIEYSKAYYQEHKAQLIERGCERMICEKCGRSVIRNNIKKHQSYPICLKYSEYKALVEAK